ncbi:TPA: NAD(P)/FAD-dependent oxidoreductase [Klebsiella variicola subsp. variicola]|uniref:phytoene desaturase family protein n=1 Tax=Klebsiella sp. JB_Kp010 TaxID=3153363 RepID=UPI0032B48C31|nr:NAD(P)/FAD-dependent oxidoreductase [Klebsiella variicola subsp. variicola]HCI6746662.1 NAD(P)/FAD-dependent oxidoreductase [Klebsiella variicola subsp. variicola]
MTTSKQYDAVLVGAGHNSLVCANYLARAGLKVLVLEARKIIGGACTSEELVPGGIFSSCSYIQMMLRSEVVNDLELGRYGLNAVAPPLQEMALWDDGERIMLWQEVDKTLRSIERHNKTDGENFMYFGARLKRFGELTHAIQLSDPPSQQQLRQLFDEAGESELFDEFMHFSAEELLQKYIQSDRLRGFMMFMGLVSTWGGPNTPGTAYVYGYHALGEFEGAFGRFGLPEGGMGMISQSLVNALQAHGGEVRTASPVQQILVEGDRATGVILTTGERVYAPMVISGADPTRSLVGLLPEGSLPEPVAEEAKKIDQRGSMGRVHLLVDALPDYIGFEPGTTGPQHQCLTIMGASPALYEMAAEAQRNGDFPPDMVLEALIPSATHPGLVAQPGTHTLSLGVQQLPFELAEGDWDSRKEEWADKVLEVYFRYAPNMREHILGRHVITPLDLHRDYHITHGNIFHQSMIGLENLFDQRPIQAAAHYRTPLPGYYLCGSGSHPGGGVSGMPGHNAAQRILADMVGLEDSAAGRKIDKADRTFLNGLLKTDVGRKLGYQIARSRVFRGLTKHLSK